MLTEHCNISVEAWTQQNDTEIHRAVDYAMNFKSGDSRMTNSDSCRVIRIQSPFSTGAIREQIHSAIDTKDGIGFV